MTDTSGQSFLERVAERNGTPTATPATIIPVTTTSPDGAYAQAALDKESAAVATAAQGTRNDTLNRAAFNLTSLVDAGQLTHDTVTQTLTNAARQAGLPDSEIRATLASGRRGSAAKVGARQIPERADIDGQVIEVDAEYFTHTHTNTGDDHDTTDPQVFHRNRVEAAAYELQIRDEAHQLFKAWQAEQLGQTRPPPIPLPELLKIPDDEAVYRVVDLWPTGGNILLAAQQKAGKTTLVANLLRALADGGNFLGRFLTAPANKIVLIDTELDERMLRRWLRDQNIVNTAAIEVVSLKGKLSTFDLLNAAVRAQWADALRGADIIILDCLRPCLDALGLSEDKDAGRFLVAWDALKVECGADESAVVQHMGHQGERSRGDSRLVDWPDVNWKIVKESQTEDDPTAVAADGGKRFFSAHGRDVMVSEGLLHWQYEDRSLTYAEGGRRDAKAYGAVEIIVSILSEPEHRDGLSTRALTEKLREEGVGKPTARAAIKHAISESAVIEHSGERNAKILSLNPSRRA